MAKSMPTKDLGEVLKTLSTGLGLLDPRTEERLDHTLRIVCGITDETGDDLVRKLATNVEQWMSTFDKPRINAEWARITAVISYNYADRLPDGRPIPKETRVAVRQARYKWVSDLHCKEYPQGRSLQRYLEEHVIPHLQSCIERALQTGVENNPSTEHGAGSEPRSDDDLAGKGLGADYSTIADGQRPRRHSIADVRVQQALSTLAEETRATLRAEERARRVADPRPLPVRWINAADELMDHWENIKHDQENPLPMNLAGELDEIAKVYCDVPSGRLVILGAAGSGKTTLVSRLALLLMDQFGFGEEGKPIPVVVNIAKWNPAVDPSLRSWLARQIAGPKRKLDREWEGSIAILMRRGHILPILDGFDELDASIGPSVIASVNRAFDADDRFILASRVDEFRTAIGDGDVLTSAAVIELQSLRPKEVMAYLRLSTKKSPHASNVVTKWDRVFRADTDDESLSKVLDALSSPLIVSLARSMYSDTDRDPIELLDERFTDSRDLVAYLLDGFILAAYTDLPEPDGSRPARRWSANRAVRWLAYLATHCHGRTRLGVHVDSLNSFVFDFSMLLVFLLACGLLLPQGKIGTSSDGEELLLCYLPFLLLGGWVADSVGESPFTQLRPSWRRLSGTSPKYFVHLGAILIPLAAFIPFVSLAGNLFLPATFHPGTVAIVSFSAALSVLLVIVASTYLGVVLFADAEDGNARGLRSDVMYKRIGSLLVLLAFTITTSASLWLFRTLAIAPNISWDWLRALVLAFIVGTVGAMSWGPAYGRWLCVRISLAIRGRLPLRLVQFVEDAHRREIFRLSGGIYEFRHALVRERLAAWGAVQAKTSDEDRRWIRLRLALSLAQDGKLDAASDHLYALLSLAKESKDDVLRAACFAGLSHVSEEQGDLEGAADFMQWAAKWEYLLYRQINRIRRFGGIGELEGVLMTRARYAGLLQRLGRLDAVLAVHEETLVYLADAGAKNSPLAAHIKSAIDQLKDQIAAGSS